MPIDRNAAVAYAKKYWNRVADDNTFWTSDDEIQLADKRRSMNAPAAAGWEAFFVGDGNGGEKAIFRRQVDGRTEDKPDPIATWHELDDCTHFVSRCLIKEGIAFTETPRANELAEAMLKSSKTKTLALKTTREQGQKVIDSGMFKPGDLVAYYTDEKGVYTHTAMFVGKPTGGADDPGGITCHTVCRFRGLTQAWNTYYDDAWFLDETKGFSYTLIHFSEDDPDISVATLQRLQGWWEIGDGFYYVLNNGHAFSTSTKPADASQKLATGDSTGYYFEVDDEVVFVWREPGGGVRVEKWGVPADAAKVAVNSDAFDGNATRVFQA
jgi:hypothetical protein